MTDPVDTIGIIGQSNGEILWTWSSPSAPVANASTFMRTLPIGQAGPWITPVNSLKVFCNELQRLTGGSVYVLPGAIGGTRLLPSPGSFAEYWLDPSPIGLGARFAQMAAGTNVRALWFIQGETECQLGPHDTATYLSGLVQLHSALADRLGKTVNNLPMFVTPLGNTAMAVSSNYPFGRSIIAAQYQVGKFPGMYVGPEHYDLSTLEGTHLDETGRYYFSIRGAQMIASVIGALRLNDPPPPVGLQKVKDINLNHQASIVNVSWRSVVAPLDRSGTNIRVRFVAHNDLPFTIKHASVGVRSPGSPYTSAAPVPLTFSGQPGATIAAGQKLFSDLAQFTFSSTNSLMVTTDFDGVNGNFRLFVVEPAPMGGSYAWLGLDTYNIQYPPVSNIIYASNIDAAGFDLIETQV